MKKVFFYFDGFNFYRGLKEAQWKECYWLDLFLFSKNLVGKYDDFEVSQVHYFTARPRDNDKMIRQRIWLNANSDLYPKNIEIHYGKYKQEEIYCQKYNKSRKEICPKCDGKFLIQREKQTDVSIAVEILHDAIKGNCDVSVIISGDNDLLPPLRYLNKFYPEHKILIYYPPLRNRSNLHNYSQFKPVHLLNTKEIFLKSKLPNKHGFKNGDFFIVPPEWDYN